MSEVRIFRGLLPDAHAPDVSVGRQIRAIPTVSMPAKEPVDLTGRPKIILAMGPGGSGKTTWLRWAAEMVLTHDPECSAIFSAIGDRRDLQHYFPVAQPDSFDPMQETQWLEALFSHCMESKVSAAIDLDGGDVTVASIVAQQQEDISATVAQSGVSMVAIYMLTPRITDLSTLATMEQGGFQPKATALVLNDGKTPANVSFDAAFGPIQQHKVFRTAVARGAVVIRMPRLDVAAKVEQWRLLFAQARDAVGDNSASHLGAWDRGKVARWLTDMSAAFAPIASWLPS